MELTWLEHIQNKLSVYRNDRRITIAGQYQILPDTIKEEYEEYINGGDEHNMIDAIADMLVLAFNATYDIDRDRLEYLIDNTSFTSAEQLVTEAKDFLIDIENTNPEMYEQAIANLILVLDKVHQVDVGMVMDEVTDHILSRRQDPEQYERWVKNPDIVEKWRKDKDQPEYEIYQPDYEKCKHNSLL